MGIYSSRLKSQIDRRKLNWKILKFKTEETGEFEVHNQNIKHLYGYNLVSYVSFIDWTQKIK